MAFYRLFCFLICLGLSPALWGQILNIEKARVEKDTSKVWIGSVGFNLSIFNRDAGEDDPRNFVNLGTNINAGYLSEKHGFILMGTVDYVEVTREPLVRNGYLHGRATLLRRRTISYELFGQFQYDVSRGLRNRYLAGGGVRWGIKEDDNTKVYLGVGAMYETEKWEVPDMEDQFLKPQLIKTTNYLSLHREFKEFLRLDAITYFQSGYDGDIDKFRHRWNLTTTLNVKLSSKLNLRTSFDCQFENRPVIPITRFIYSLTNGLAYEL